MRSIIVDKPLILFSKVTLSSSQPGHKLALNGSKWWKWTG